MVLLPVIFTNTHSYFPMPYLILVFNLESFIDSTVQRFLHQKIDTQYWKKLSTIRQLDYVHDYLH